MSTRSERTAFPTPDLGSQPGLKAPRSREFQHSLYNQPQVSSFDQLQRTMDKTAKRLKFSTDTGEAFKQSDPLILPRIEPFLPSGTDADAAKSLTALYRSHCTSLVECIRYCKEKTFFHLFTSFQGTLTMPVQKLFSHPAIAPWIEECDFILYQRMMRIVSGLTLQVVPKPVLDTLRSISERLVRHIRESFHGQPAHVLRAKEAPAALFAGLLDRALRVNLTAHAAANMLSNPANRDLMYAEFISMINVRKISESIPSRGMDDVVNVLLTEMRHLLDPVNVPWDIECLTVHGDVPPQSRQSQEAVQDDTSASNVLDRWVNFLRSLPSRFPYASATDVVWCAQRLGTALMRDLTIGQGKSFGSWWVTKCWLDEMVEFMAEQGGFMQQRGSGGLGGLGVGLAGDGRGGLSVAKRGQQQNIGGGGSRYSSGSDDFHHLGGRNGGGEHDGLLGGGQPDRAVFPSGPGTGGGGQGGQQNPDDSGIGIRTPDEDLPGEKFGSPVGGEGDLFGEGGLDL